MNNDQYAFTSINRHTIQSILHIALSEASCHFGLLASNSKSIINACSTDLVMDHDDSMQAILHAISDTEHSLHQRIMNIATMWQKQGIQALGFFHSCPVSIEQAAKLKQFTQQYLKPQTDSLHLHLQLDTKGRLDTLAWTFREMQIIPLPLDMTEDGNYEQF